MLSKEQLLQARFKVMGPFPHMNCKVGDILDFSDGYSSKRITRTPHDDPWGETNYTTHGFDQFELQEYPNLFQPLPWYSDRKPEEMPEYVITKQIFESDNVRCFKVSEWYIYKPPIDEADMIGFTSPDGHRIGAHAVLPIDESEYLAYTKK